MFNYVIITNKVTPEITKSLEILMKTSLIHDNIIVVNYNNYNIKYRSLEGIDYRHVKQSRKQAINRSLPRDANVVLIGSEFIVSKNFVKDLYQHIDYKSLTALRVDDVSPDGKYVDRDYRVGSTITTKSFTQLALVFNTSLISKVGETALETATIAQQWDVPLVLNPNIRVLKTSKKKRPIKTVGVTILIPSLQYENIDVVREMAKANDMIYEFESTPRGLVRFVNKKVLESHNECILIINPESKIQNFDMLNKIRGLFDKNKCILFDTHDELTDNAWLVIPRGMFNYSNELVNSPYHLQESILAQNPDVVKYHERLNKKRDRIVENVVGEDMISIIIPFMYNGDRWPLFRSTIERLHKYTKDHDNIEIIVHETAPRRVIRPEFIEKFDLVYVFSEYHGLFHRAWNLNFVARYIAKGSTFVFFDADLLIDETWVNELLSCDKTKSYLGWGVMKNLNRTGTEHFISTRKIKNLLERTRIPSALAAAAGINVVPRDTIFDIGGWPEAYKDLGYGGEDNSFAFKMTKLGHYNKNMSTNIFKSTVYHLFHGHETEKNGGRHPIFQKHKQYDRLDWLDHIRRWYDWGKPLSNNIDMSKTKPYINETLLYTHRHAFEPLITICMVNFLRYDILIKNLTRLLEFDIPINIILWINQFESMPESTLEEVKSLLCKFAGHEIMYSKKNMGTGYPRYSMLTKARYEYDTEYIMITDDDVLHHNSESLVLGATVLDQKEYDDYGAIGLWVTPNQKMITIGDGTVWKELPYEGFHNVDCLSSSLITVRKKVIDTCNFDPRYIVGYDDWDFSLAMKQEGYKLGLVCDDRYIPQNVTRGISDEYKQQRYDGQVIENSKKIFEDKWKLELR